jgi:hypothetical protein
MRATRIRNDSLLGDYTLVPRDPLNDPLYGDIVEGIDGELRFVEIRPRQRAKDIRYRCAGGRSALPLKCTLSDWRHWAKGGKVLCTTPTRTRFDSISHHPVFVTGECASAGL